MGYDYDYDWDDRDELSGHHAAGAAEAAAENAWDEDGDNFDPETGVEYDEDGNSKYEKAMGFPGEDEEE